MERSPEKLSEVMLDLALAANQPMNVGGRDGTLTVAAVNALGCMTQAMGLKELRTLEYAVDPLLILLQQSDIDDPVVEKSSFALKTLMSSRICMREFISKDGLIIIGKLFDFLLGIDLDLDLHVPSHYTIVLEHLCQIYKDISVHYPWDIIRVGGLRHCVALLRRGVPGLQATAVGALASMCIDEDICKLMFSNGATKPIIAVSDADKTNEICMLAGLGCIAQLARLPDVAIKIARQGVIPVLEKALDRTAGVTPQLIREKAIFALEWMSRTPQIRHALATPRMLKGLSKQMFDGTILAKTAVASILLHLHGKYPKPVELELLRGVRKEMIDMLGQGKWSGKNLFIKVFCVLYKEEDDKVYLVENGILPKLYEIMEAKPEDLVEAPIVVLLSLAQHPDLPVPIMNSGALPMLCRIIVKSDDPIIVELIGILFKTLALHDHDRVEETLDELIPVEKSHLKRLDSPECTLYGSEFGGLIQEYLQRVVHHRWDQKYLLDQFDDEELEDIGISDELMEAYQKSFMELDLACRGFLEIDALKVIMVLRGEMIDDDELQEIFDEYDSEGTGKMDFSQFIDLMRGWKRRFGMGADALINRAFNSGMIGRARRIFNRWWNAQKIANARIAKIKEKREKERLRTQQLAATFLRGEDIKLKREQEIALRAAKVAAGSAAVSRDSEYSDSDYGGTRSNSPRSPAGMTSKSPLSPSKMHVNFSPENKVDSTVRKKGTKTTPKKNSLHSS